MNSRKLRLILCFVSLLCSSDFLFSQSKGEINLTTPLKSLEVLSDALIKKDSILISKIATGEGYNDVKSKNLFLHGKDWMVAIRKKRVTIFHDSKGVQILKIGDKDYLLSFTLEEKIKQWKFTAFITQP